MTLDLLPAPLSPLTELRRTLSACPVCFCPSASCLLAARAPRAQMEIESVRLAAVSRGGRSTRLHRSFSVKVKLKNVQNNSSQVTSADVVPWRRSTFYSVLQPDGKLSVESQFIRNKLQLFNFLCVNYFHLVCSSQDRESLMYLRDTQVFMLVSSTALWVM